MAEVMQPDGFCPDHQPDPSALPAAERDAALDAGVATCAVLAALARVSLAFHALVTACCDDLDPERVYSAAAAFVQKHWACRRLFARHLLGAGSEGAASEEMVLDVLGRRVITQAFPDHLVSLLCALLAETDVKRRLAASLADNHHYVRTWSWDVERSTNGCGEKELENAGKSCLPCID